MNTRQIAHDYYRLGSHIILYVIDNSCSTHGIIKQVSAMFMNIDGVTQIKAVMNAVLYNTIDLDYVKASAKTWDVLIEHCKITFIKT